MKTEDNVPSIYDKDWQETKELGKVKKTFKYVGTDGKPSTVTAEATIHPGQQYEVIEQANTKKDDKGIKRLDTKKHSRSIMKLVYGIDGTGLNNILSNKGGDLFNKMRAFAFEISGLAISSDEVEDEKN